MPFVTFSVTYSAQNIDYRYKQVFFKIENGLDVNGEWEETVNGIGYRILCGEQLKDGGRRSSQD